MCSPVTRSAPLLPAGNPRIVGIVNMTADSFSDGGRYLDPAAAVARARRLRADGADVVELGPAASHRTPRRSRSRRSGGGWPRS